MEELAAVRQTLQTDLGTSIRRIADLQAALEEVASSDSDTERYPERAHGDWAQWVGCTLRGAVAFCGRSSRSGLGLPSLGDPGVFGAGGVWPARGRGGVPPCPACRAFGGEAVWGSGGKGTALCDLGQVVCLLWA